jgi:hypothetical protein
MNDDEEARSDPGLRFDDPHKWKWAPTCAPFPPYEHEKVTYVVEYEPVTPEPEPADEAKAEDWEDELANWDGEYEEPENSNSRTKTLIFAGLAAVAVAAIIYRLARRN